MRHNEQVVEGEEKENRIRSHANRRKREATTIQKRRHLGHERALIASVFLSSMSITRSRQSPRRARRTFCLLVTHPLPSSPSPGPAAVFLINRDFFSLWLSSPRSIFITAAANPWGLDCMFCGLQDPIFYWRNRFHFPVTGLSSFPWGAPLRPPRSYILL